MGSKNRSSLPGGVYLRGNVYYVEKRHRRLPGGRIRKSLETGDLSLVEARVGAVRTLMDRGDWLVLQRWAEGGLDITDLTAAVREGNYASLRKLAPSAPTLQAAVDDFLMEIDATRSGRTYQQYKTVCRALLAHFGNVPMDQVTEAGVRDFLFSPKETAGGRVWHQTTQSHAQTVCGSIFHRVIEQEAREAARLNAVPTLTANPFRAVVRVRRTNGRVSFLHREEWQDLFRAVEGTPYAAWCACAFLAGLRQQEAAILRTDIDVDLERKMLRVRGTKNITAVRDVPISPKLEEILREHVRLGYAGDRAFFRPAGEDKPISRQTSIRWTREAYAMAGIKYGRESEDGLTHHSGRHSFATWLAQENVSPLIIAKLLGDTVETVVRVYCHLNPRDLVDAVNRL